MTTGHVSRRSLLAGMTAAAPAFLLSPQAQAKDEIFKPNPLTNPVLEQVRFVLLALSHREREEESLVAPNGLIFHLFNRQYAKGRNTKA